LTARDDSVTSAVPAMHPFPRLTHVFVALALAGCAGAPPREVADALSVSKSGPPEGAQELGSVRGVDGSGCGIFGVAGTRDGAVAKLRAQAKSLGADYVELTLEREPYVDHQCKHREYVVEGVAYRVHPKPAAAPPAPVVPPAVLAPARASSGAGMLLSANGCGFRASTPGATRALAFSARASKSLRVWIDVSERDELAPGLELVYERSARRLALLRYPGETPVSVAREPFELDEAWHAWRIVRTAEQLVVTLDGQQVLVYIAPAGSGEASFRLGGEAVELRDIAMASPAD